MLKKLFTMIVLLVCCMTAFAAPITKLVFFGDSLSDDGNLYRLSFKIIPKSPPYFQGRFSNGPSWSEFMAKHYYDKYYVESKNYAMGGATAIFHMPSTKFFSPSTLQLQVDKYLFDSLFSDRSNTLFSIWIGSNDYLYGKEPDVNVLTDQVVNKIAWAVTTLNNWGGKEFLILNVPDLSLTPYAKNDPMRERYKVLNELHNQKLAALVDELRKNYPDIRITYIDTDSMLKAAIRDPDTYNKIFNVHITNTTDACWGGGFTLLNSMQKMSLKQEIQATLDKSTDKAARTIDAQAMSEFISSSPSLSVAYNVGQSYQRGNVPCSNPQEYIFWDKMHPTQVAAEIISKVVVESLNPVMERN